MDKDQEVVREELFSLRSRHFQEIKHRHRVDIGVYTFLQALIPWK